MTPIPEIYYHARRKEYYVRNDRGAWITVNEGSAKRHIRRLGFSGDKTGELSPADNCLADIQLQHDVSYAGPLAGYSSGLFDINERRVLVTEAPRLIEPEEGTWPLLDGIFEGMLNDGSYDQRPYMFGWIKIAIESLRAKQWQPGQVLAMAGPVRSAKSLCQALITKILGGRSAKPYQFMTGATNFNADLFAAEHLMVEDAAESTDIRKRRTFGAHIKQFAVNQEQYCHGKNVQALTLTPLWRVTVTLNDEPERLLVLPPIDEDIHDKITLLSVRRREMPMPTGCAAEVKAFWTALVDELPAFLHYLHQWEIPPELKSPRYGILHFHHPALLAALDGLSPELQLMEMIDSEMFRSPLARRSGWSGTALQLRNALTGENCPCGEAADALLHSPVATGAYLSRLASKYPDRVAVRRINGTSIYALTPPSNRGEASGTVAADL